VTVTDKNNIHKEIKEELHTVSLFRIFNPLFSQL